MEWNGTTTKYGCEMPISELLTIVADIEKLSGLSIYDILMFFNEGYTLRKIQPDEKDLYTMSTKGFQL